MIKGILLDIDNTLYDYDKTHKKAMERIRGEISSFYNIDEFNGAFLKARDEIHKNLINSASSHNRLLYFQRALEMLNHKNILFAYDLYKIYWDEFIENIELFDNVIEFLNKNQDKKICIVTDLSANIQYRKIKKMNISKYIDAIVTSEEAGIEKPDKKIFQKALDKIRLEPKEVCMIGDSYQKDILGAKNFNLKAYLLHKENQKPPKTNDYKGFNSYKELIELIEREK